MTNEQCGMPGQPTTGFCPHKRISWSAIIVGALIAVGLGFLLNLFIMAIGLSLVKTTSDGMTSVAVGGYLGLVIGTIAIMFTAGWAAGHLGRHYCPKKNHGALYGFTVWCVALILTVLLAGNMARHMMAYSEFVTHPMSTSVVVMKMDKTSSEMQKPMTKSESKEMMNNASLKPVHDLGSVSLLIFTIFFIGALSCCFGGHCGMTSCREDKCS